MALDHFAKIPQKLQNLQEKVCGTGSSELIRPQSFYAGTSVPDCNSSNVGNGLKRKIPESLLTVKKMIRVHEVSNQGDKLNEEFSHKDNLSGNYWKKSPEQTKFAPTPSLVSLKKLRKKSRNGFIHVPSSYVGYVL